MLEGKNKDLLERFKAAVLRSKFDPIFFIESFCKLKDQRIGEPIPFLLWDCQKEQCEAWTTYDETITLKTRQCGISWLSGAFGLWECFFNQYFECMVISKKAVHSALFIALTMINLAILYVANAAPFLGMVQIIVYTGAVMMLFLFVLMVVGVDSSDSLIETIKGQRAAALLFGVGFSILLTQQPASARHACHQVERERHDLQTDEHDE